jgi:hypothetical protein
MNIEPFYIWWGFFLYSFTIVSPMTNLATNIFSDFPLTFIESIYLFVSFVFMLFSYFKLLQNAGTNANVITRFGNKYN